MARRWTANAVVSVAVKHGRRVVAQLLESPFLYVFPCFFDDGDSVEIDLRAVEPLFCTAVTRQFLRLSDLRKEAGVTPRKGLRKPKYWINSHDGWRKVVVWPGARRKRELLLMGEQPGGMLVLRDELVGEDVDLDDDEMIDAHELTNIWTFPLLNERLHLCDRLGRNVDPMKDVTFDRTPPAEAATFIDILGSRGDLASWGYAASAKRRSPKSGKRKAQKRKAPSKKT